MINMRRKGNLSIAEEFYLKNIHGESVTGIYLQNKELKKRLKSLTQRLLFIEERVKLLEKSNTKYKKKA